MVQTISIDYMNYTWHYAYDINDPANMNHRVRRMRCCFVHLITSVFLNIYGEISSLLLTAQKTIDPSPQYGDILQYFLHLALTSRHQYQWAKIFNLFFI